MVDNVADLLFAPTDIAYKCLDGYKNVFLTGNTVYDNLLGHERKEPKDYILVTLHRPETVDNLNNLSNVLKGIGKIAKTYKFNIRFLVHPRTQDKLKRLDCDVFEKPVGYCDFINLVKEASLVVTDSGGLQEEAAILKVPCLTTRENTERPETVIAKLNILTGFNPSVILSSAGDIFNYFDRNMYDKKPLYGNGYAGEKIVKILEEQL
jgi:UDP-N-acetylglucosamine 2-epimerase (non-hydrolysing)